MRVRWERKSEGGRERDSMSEQERGEGGKGEGESGRGKEKVEAVRVRESATCYSSFSRSLHHPFGCMFGS